MRSNWRDCALGELARIKHGYAFKGEFFGSAGTHVVLTPGNFHETGGFKEKADKAKWYSGPVPEEYVLDAGDLIVAMTEQGEGLLGSSALVPRPGFYLHNQRLGLVTPSSSTAADRGFLYYLFNSWSVRQQIRASANGAKIRHTSPARIYEVKVRVPDISAQRRIASILAAYDELIENNTRRIAILEEMARRIYEEWFVRFRFPGHESVRMVESELGLMPEGWRAATVATIAERIGATVNPGAFPDELFEHFSIPAFDAARRAVMEPGRGIMSNKTLLNGDAVLVSKLNPRIPRIWSVSGRSSRKRVCSTEFIPFIPKLPYTGHLLYLFFSSAWFQERYLGLAVGTSTSHQRVKPADTERIEAIVPSEHVASKADQLLAPILDLVENLRLKIVNLRTTRDLLLPKLISGELDVSAMPEPAALAA